MKKNYLPWNLKVSDFPVNGPLPAKLNFLLNFAVLSPSSHNSQPWAFKIRSNSILVEPNLERALQISDKNERQLNISLGCAITNLITAADYFGFQANINYDSQGETGVLITLEESKNETPDKNHLIFEISKRTTNRNKYSAQVPSEHFFENIRSLSSPEIRIDIVKNLNEKNQLADVALKSMSAAMSDKEFRKELAAYLKSNITNSKLGMPAFGMGIPTAASLVAPSLIGKVNMSKLTYKQDEELLKKHTPTIVVISTLGDERKDWLRAGEVYEKIALQAEKNGIKTAIWAAPVQIGSYYKDLQQILKMDFRPQVFFRLGYTDKITPHSPRLAGQEVINQ